MSLRVLLIDDNPGELRFLRTLFVRHPAFATFQLRVLEAEDGDEGFELFLREKPDLVVVDLLLPKMDGAALCGEIRRHQGDREVAVVAISSIYREEQLARQLLQEHGVVFVPKPIDLQRFPGLVLRLLGKAREVDAAAPRRWTTPTDALEPAEPGDARADADAEEPPHDGSEGAEAPDSAAMEDRAVNAFGPSGSAATGAPVFSAEPRGTLEDISLAALLAHARDQRATGALKLSRGKLHKIIYLRAGRPVFVDSNVRNETLGAYLLAKRIIDEHGLTRAMKHARSNNVKLGQALVQLGLVSPDVVDAGLQAQTRLKTLSALRWTDGAFSFVEGDDFSGTLPDCDFEALPLVLAALERLYRGEVSGEILRTYENHAVQLSALGQRLFDACCEAFSQRFMDGVRQQLKVQRLAEIDGDFAVGLARLAALKAAGLVVLWSAASDAGPLGSSAEITRSARAVRSGRSSEPALGHLEPNPERSTPSAMLEALELGWTGGGAARPGGAAEADEGEVVPASDSAPSFAAECAEGGETNDHDWLERKVAGVGRQTFYQLLGLEPSASAAEVARAADEILARCTRAEAGEADPEACRLLRDEIRGAMDVLSDEQRRAEYDEWINVARTVQPPTRGESFTAELSYREARRLLGQGQPEQAMAILRQVLDGSPEQADYLALYGWALYQYRQGGVDGATVARPHLEAALQLAPESPQINLWLASLEEGAGNLRAAIGPLQEALRHGPADLGVYQRLKALLMRLAEYEQLERVCRNMIFRLREDDPQATLPYWLDLALLYQDKLGQPADAQLALRVAQKLAPADPQVIEVSERASTVEATRWAEVCARLVAQASTDAGDIEALQELFAAYQRTAQPERVLAVAAILGARGRATDEQRALLARLRPRALVRRDPFSEEELDELRHPADGRLVEQVVVELTDVLCEAFPVPLEALGSGERWHVELEQLPEAVASTLAYAAELLAVDLPRLYISSTLAGVVPRPEREPALVIGESLLAQPDQRQLAFTAARAVSCLSVGRRHVFARSGTDLKTAFLAALSACQSGIPAADPSGAVARLRDRIKRDADRLHRLGESLHQLFAAGSRLNLSDWVRGVRRTSARIGLLACGDALTALQQCGADPTVMQDLVAFMLSRQVGNACTDLPHA